MNRFGQGDPVFYPGLFLSRVRARSRRPPRAIPNEFRNLI